MTCAPDKLILGNPVCQTCGQRHPIGFDCVADKEARDREFSEMIERHSIPADELPPHATKALERVTSVERLQERIAELEGALEQSLAYAYIIQTLSEKADEKLPHDMPSDLTAWVSSRLIPELSGALKGETRKGEG